MTKNGDCLRSPRFFPFRLLFAAKQLDHHADRRHSSDSTGNDEEQLLVVQAVLAVQSEVQTGLLLRLPGLPVFVRERLL